MKKIIVVLGMHRSGTSALTKGLEVLGVKLGNNLMPGVQGENDKGFWEDKRFNEINEKILRTLNLSWDSLAPLDLNVLEGETFSAIKSEALALVKETVNSAELFAFKDPRTVNLLPFWQSVFEELNVDDSYILVIRDPRSVADSLAKRNDFLQEKSLFLWGKHIYNAMRYLHQAKAVVIDYDNLLSDPVLQVQRIAKALELTVENSDLMDEYANDFLSKELRHSQYSESLSGKVPDSVNNLYQWLKQAADSCIDDAQYRNASGWESFNTFADYDSLIKIVDYSEAKRSHQQSLYQQRISELQENLEQQKRSLEQQNLSLEQQKQHIYEMFVEFNNSALGRLFSFQEKLYRFLRTFGAGSEKTAYGYLVALSQGTVNRLGHQHEEKVNSRFYLFLQIMRYFFKHPYSSLRLLNTSTLTRMIKMLFSKDRGQAANWVAMRFPDSISVENKPIIFDADENCDVLEIVFPEHRTPRLSIVIPVYNQYRMTVSCLQSILKHTVDIEYEIIIADDCSQDITQSIENRIKNIRVIRGTENVGFVRNCNNAVSEAIGEYVVLLNNDTNVQNDWARALLDTLEDEDNGLVGPKLLFDDGVLQEAGGIIWRDGSGWNYGRGQNPELPEFNYLRETDYISGACIMFRKKIWDELGGFDEAFVPAYYEDTDFAFKVRQSGLKVIYQPRSVVVHFEGVSNGTDLTQGVKQYQSTNQDKFTKKWQAVLERSHYENGENVFSARDKSMHRKTVVFVDHYVPFYDKDAGSRSTFRYIEAMLESDINVKFIPANFFPHQPYTQVIQHMGVEVLYGEVYAKTWKNWFADNAANIDVIYLHRPHVTEDFIDFLTQLAPKPKLIYFGHDLHFLRIQREAEQTENGQLEEQAESWKKREFEIFKKVDTVFYPSQVEADQVKSVMPDIEVSTIPLYRLEKMQLPDYQHASRRDLLFVGGFNHPPNADAVNWFSSEILPAMKKTRTDIILHVVGSNVPDSIKNVASLNIVIHGFLSDEELSELYQKIRICIVPLRFGAGVKGKVLEAMQANLPIITTSIGAEGIPEAERIMRINDDAMSFAKSIIELYDDPQSCDKYVKHYPQYIEKYFSRQSVQKIIDQHFIN